MASVSVEELFRRVILLNELGGDMAEALRFSDPDGVRSGKSGWSFGLCQFDTRNNDQAVACLRDCGFTDAEIKGIVNQTADVAPLNKRLSDHAGIIIDYDRAQLARCINAARTFAADHAIPLAETGALLALADTVNQYGSLGTGSAAYLVGLGRPVTAADVLAMKLRWKYSQTDHGRRDTIRRAANIAKVVEVVA